MPHSTCNNSWAGDPLTADFHTLLTQRWSVQVYNSPFWNTTSALSTPPHQTPLLLGLFKHILGPPPPPKHKDSIYQYILVTFRGQCCCRCITEIQLCISRPPCLFGARQQGSSADPHGVKPSTCAFSALTWSRWNCSDCWFSPAERCNHVSRNDAAHCPSRQLWPIVNLEPRFHPIVTEV